MSPFHNSLLFSVRNGAKVQYKVDPFSTYEFPLSFCLQVNLTWKGNSVLGRRLLGSLLHFCYPTYYLLSLPFSCLQNRALLFGTPETSCMREKSNHSTNRIDTFCWLPFLQIGKALLLCAVALFKFNLRATPLQTFNSGIRIYVFKSPG